MIRLHTVDLHLFFALFFNILISFKKKKFNASVVDYSNMLTCQDQKLFESYDYNIINYVKFPTLYIYIYYEVYYLMLIREGVSLNCL